jgi:hypothetical protein
MIKDIQNLENFLFNENKEEFLKNLIEGTD